MAPKKASKKALKKALSTAAKKALKKAVKKAPNKYVIGGLAKKSARGLDSRAKSIVKVQRFRVADAIAEPGNGGGTDDPGYSVSGED
jgi:hypothetical protein